MYQYLMRIKKYLIMRYKAQKHLMKMYQLTLVSCDDTLHMLTRKCSLENILKPPLPIKKAQPLPSQTTSVRVLTSKENLKIMQQKEKEKRDLAQKKLEKKAERELKRRNRELAARKAKVKKADKSKY